MPIRAGFLTEGHDYLILHAYLAKLLDIPEVEIKAESREGSDHGRDFVLTNIDETLRRYYGMCLQLVIIAVDNDGNHDLRVTGDSEDPNRPRHWQHEGAHRPEACRWCFIQQQVERTRQSLTWFGCSIGRVLGGSRITHAASKPSPTRSASTGTRS